MPELVDVSAAFRNCSFHGIAAHLLAHQDQANEQGIINKIFAHPKGESDLTDLLNSAEAFENFFVQLRQKKAKESPSTNEFEGEAFEKILILGVALRNYLQQILLTENAIKGPNQARFVQMVKSAPDLIDALGNSEVYIHSLSETENGVMLEASRELFKNSEAIRKLTEEQIIKLWQSKYAKAYAQKVGTLNVNLSFCDMTPLCDDLNIALSMFDYDQSAENGKGRCLHQSDNGAAPIADTQPTDFATLNLLLHNQDQHYHVELPSNNDFTAALKRDHGCYEKYRTQLLEIEANQKGKRILAKDANLLFLDFLILDSNQIAQKKKAFYKAIKTTLSIPTKKNCLALTDLNDDLKLFKSKEPVKNKPKEQLTDNELLTELLTHTRNFMKYKKPLPNFRPKNTLNELRIHCNLGHYADVIKHPETNKVLSKRIKELQPYKNLAIFQQLITCIDKMPLSNQVPLKLAIYGLFHLSSDDQADKLAICNKLNSIAQHLSGVADGNLQVAALLLGTLMVITSALVLSLSSAVILPITLLAIGILGSAIMFINSCETGDALAMNKFVNEYKEKESLIALSLA